MILKQATFYFQINLIQTKPKLYKKQKLQLSQAFERVWWVSYLLRKLVYIIELVRFLNFSNLLLSWGTMEESENSIYFRICLHNIPFIIQQTYWFFDKLVLCRYVIMFIWLNLSILVVKQNGVNIIGVYTNISKTTEN